MNLRSIFTAFLVWSLACPLPPAPIAHGCCAVYRTGQFVANADQTVIILWDAERKIQHFIRKAHFKTGSDAANADDVASHRDFGFIIPTPSRPELDESGNEAFDLLANWTAPKIIVGGQTAPQRSMFGCGGPYPAAKSVKAAPPVRVLEEKLVAGFNAVVLEADSAAELVNWLKEHEYNYSPAVEAWARPYVEQKWKFTALKIANDPSPPSDENAEVERHPERSEETAPASKVAQGSNNVAATALRISFEADRPLFPYREPEYGAELDRLQAKQRLLRFYFIADKRYEGNLTESKPWTGKAVWSRNLSDIERGALLRKLKLPEVLGPKEFTLTEFEDRWPYEVAPADLYFSVSKDQSQLERPAIYASSPPSSSGDVALFALFAVVTIPILTRRRKRI